MITDSGAFEFKRTTEGSELVMAPKLLLGLATAIQAALDLWEEDPKTAETLLESSRKRLEQVGHEVRTGIASLRSR